MRKEIVISLIFGLFAAFQSNAQEQEAKKEGARQAEFNTESQDVNSSGAREGGNENPEDQVQDAASPANTMGTDTRTVSSAGSPGVLMADEESPDGTNTLQRASLNIAGSPVPGGTSKSARVKTDDRSEYRTFGGKTQKKVSPGRLSDPAVGKKKEDRKK
jgi:hypothetical protein